jgi:hypothetical protein
MLSYKHQNHSEMPFSLQFPVPKVVVLDKIYNFIVKTFLVEIIY